jgi:hypothetical protein
MMVLVLVLVLVGTGARAERVDPPDMRRRRPRAPKTRYRCYSTVGFPTD